MCNRFGSAMEPPMPTLTLKALPAELHRRLKARAEQNGRSLNREVIECLERTFEVERIDDEALSEKARRARARRSM